MPEVSFGRYLIGYMQELGWAKAEEPIPWSEIESWARLTKKVLSAWEGEVLGYMSACYHSQYVKSSDPNCPDPRDENAVVAPGRRKPMKTRLKVIR